MVHIPYQGLIDYTILYYTILHYTILYYTILYYTILYYTILYYTILYYTILYYTILYYTILYYTILYYTILYYTMVHSVNLLDNFVLKAPGLRLIHQRWTYRFEALPKGALIGIQGTWDLSTSTSLQAGRKGHGRS